MVKGCQVVFLISLAASAGIFEVCTATNYYGEALSKCILFFEGQRSGKLPVDQRLTWRKDSALKDGSDVNMDLTGGYYDAGDNVKFNFPMAFTTTMLAWGMIEYGQYMPNSEREYAVKAIVWGTDYLLKSTNKPNSVVAVVGNPNGDHGCWERPEDMDTPRTAYLVTAKKPGSEVSAETAAALAASSIALKDSAADYSKLLLRRARDVFTFADKYRGSYNDSVGEAVCPFYCDFNGYMDELVWAASWLHKATGESYYWNYIQGIAKSLMKGSVLRNWFGKSVTYEQSFGEFGWDAKYAGINVLVSQTVMKSSSEGQHFVTDADRFVCSVLPSSPSKSVSYSPGGLLFKPGGSNLQHATSLSFLLVTYACYIKAAGRTVNCGGLTADSSALIQVAKSQVDYILGKNPLGMSYMVGLGQKFPQKIHHRGSTLPSLDSRPNRITCRGGDKYLYGQAPNPNLLVGAIVGGPAQDDSFQDSRLNVPQSEPTTYMNAPLVGLLAYFAASG